MQWQYQVIRLNIDSDSKKSQDIRNPETASEKMKGSLSPEFIKNQFPEQYSSSDISSDPALQLSNFLNAKGKEGWELFQSLRIGGIFLLIMKKPLVEESNN